MSEVLSKTLHGDFDSVFHVPKLNILKLREMLSLLVTKQYVS